MSYANNTESSTNQESETDTTTIIQTDGQDSIELPESFTAADSEITRDGSDLVIENSAGETVVIEGYFSAATAPDLDTADGSVLSPDLIASFAKSTPQYAQRGSLNDESPIGNVQELSGDATVTRTDGTTETITLGTPIYQGDIVETDEEGSVNIVFSDESSFAVSNNARLAIDEYVFDPASESGVQNFSMLRGVFIFTSGLIGREDPDDVEIDTPVGSIGIRGTTIAGDVDSGEITVIEGAIVLRDLDGNEITLASQFDSATLRPGQTTELHGQKDAGEIADKYQSILDVTPSLSSSLMEQIEQSSEETQQDMRQDPTSEQEPSGESTDSEGADTSDTSHPDEVMLNETLDPNADAEMIEAVQQMDGETIQFFENMLFEPEPILDPLSGEPTLEGNTTSDGGTIDGFETQNIGDPLTETIINPELLNETEFVDPFEGMILFSNLSVLPNPGSPSLLADGFSPYDTMVDDLSGGHNLQVGYGVGVPATYKTILMRDGSDKVTLDNGDFNNIHMGDGNDVVDILSGSKGNIIDGGHGHDLFKINKESGGDFGDENILFGNNGDDLFVIDTGLIGDNLPQNMMIDGGDNYFRALEVMGVESDNNAGRGDTIKFTNINFSSLDLTTGSLDFSNVEILELGAGALSKTVFLDFNTIFSMTDDRNTLLLNLDNNSLVLSGGTKTDTGDNFAVDSNIGDNVTMGTGDDINYDVYSYTDGIDTVTLLISDGTNLIP